MSQIPVTAPNMLWNFQSDPGDVSAVPEEPHRAVAKRQGTRGLKARDFQQHPVTSGK